MLESQRSVRSTEWMDSSSEDGSAAFIQVEIAGNGLLILWIVPVHSWTTVGSISASCAVAHVHLDATRDRVATALPLMSRVDVDMAQPGWRGVLQSAVPAGGRVGLALLEADEGHRTVARAFLEELEAIVIRQTAACAAAASIATTAATSTYSVERHGTEWCPCDPWAEGLGIEPADSPPVPTPQLSLDDSCVSEHGGCPSTEPAGLGSKTLDSFEIFP
jgi:hypothetical protein